MTLRVTSSQEGHVSGILFNGNFNYYLSIFFHSLLRVSRFHPGVPVLMIHMYQCYFPRFIQFAPSIFTSKISKQNFFQIFHKFFLFCKFNSWAAKCVNTFFSPFFTIERYFGASLAIFSTEIITLKRKRHTSVVNLMESHFSIDQEIV